MKRTYLVIAGVSAFLLFYFLFFFIEGGEDCYIKDPETNRPLLGSPAAGVGKHFSLFGYTMFLLTGGERETNGGICITDIY